MSITGDKLSALHARLLRCCFPSSSGRAHARKAIPSIFSSYRRSSSGNLRCACAQAERGMLPAVFAERGPHDISAMAVIASSMGIVFLGLLSFESIVEILNFLCEYGIALISRWSCECQKSSLVSSQTVGIWLCFPSVLEAECVCGCKSWIPRKCSATTIK